MPCPPTKPTPAHCAVNQGQGWRTAGQRRGDSSSEPTPAGQSGRLPDPRRHLLHVEFALVDVYPARVLILACAGWNGSQRRAIDEGHPYVMGEDVLTHEPPFALDAIEGRVHLTALRVSGTLRSISSSRRRPTSLFHPGMPSDVDLHRGVAVGLRDLRVAACEEAGFGRPARRRPSLRPSLTSLTSFRPWCLLRSNVSPGFLYAAYVSKLSAPACETQSRYRRILFIPSLAPHPAARPGRYTPVRSR